MNKLLVAWMLFCCSTWFSAFGQDATTIRKKQYNLNKSLAIEGYDPVSYFTVQKAVKGNATWASNYNGVIYYFSSQQNLNLFKTNPSKYEPQFGGWCAYAMGNTGEKVEVDPETFKILNGKLYLFYNKLFTNTLKSWNKNENKLLNQANANWLKFTK